MDKEEKKLLESIEGIIQTYNLFDKEIYVSYSGGKDSWLLCNMLKKLGYIVHAIIIDIGYEYDWHNAINILKILGIDSEIIDKSRVTDEIRLTIEQNFMGVETISRHNNFNKNTICTPCYNAKMILLDWWAQTNNVECIAIGHHGTDAISSMLKSYYMYVDRWIFDHKEYDYSNFDRLIRSQIYLYEGNANNRQEALLNDIEQKVKERKAGIDEPIRKYLPNSRVCICSPMFSIQKKQISDYVKRKRYTFEKGECFLKHRVASIYTPRELVQSILLEKASDEMLEKLLNIAEDSLNEDGTLRFNVRNNRGRILGVEYKDTLINKFKI